LLAQRDAAKLTVAVAAFLGDAAATAQLKAMMALETTLPAQLAAITDPATLAAFVPTALQVATVTLTPVLTAVPAPITG
jgi:hypothetical protein